jgi:hypothetical protein
MLCSTFRTITRDDGRNSSEFENEWRADNISGRSQNGRSDFISDFSYTRARGYEIRERSAARSRAAQLRLTFARLTYKLFGMFGDCRTYWLVC